MEEEWDDALLSEIAALESRHLQSSSSSTNNGRSNSVANVSMSSTAASAGGASADGGPWSCKSCTLQNVATRATCLVCSTPRGKTFAAAPASTRPAPVSSSQGGSAKRTVQSTLPFGGSAAPMVVASPPKQQRQSPPSRGQRATRATATTTAVRAIPGLTLTSSRYANTAASSGLTALQTPPLLVPIERRAAGEDAQAKKRYLDVMDRSEFPQIDFEKAQQFVYPTNYAVRDYQLTIAEKALYHNTLVSLPTGLGKTLIAAVVMYNFYRWFPTGKIVFMAPTKPLVAQQIRACHEIMGIPLTDTAELQGNVPPAQRRVLWSSKRVFFCTPQSLQNDLQRGVCAAEKFVCMVIDEAHRATGNYAYCIAVQEIEAKTRFFRVLALSATPGAKFDVIQDVVTNLRISHIESRSADDVDVKKYTHARQEEVVVCCLSEQITQVKTLFLKVFRPVLHRLVRGNIIQFSDPGKLSSWYVLQARERFRKSPGYDANRAAESDLALLISLLHAKSLLMNHGLNGFREQVNNWIEERKSGRMSWSKKEMLQSSDFHALELSLAASANSINTASHPKLVKLREVLHEHFQRHAAGNSSTRAIVFTQYRASVTEIVALLRPLSPLLSVQPFVGQGASGKAKENKGQTQKLQQEIVRKFRLGEFNVLVATCIAEEGLDIGEVDLIVSFDALTSPVRMIQRMGRTGRKRVGKVIILVTEGDEQKKLSRSASAAKTVSRALTTFKNKFKYSKCPRMLPTGIYPQLSELEMHIPDFQASQVGGSRSSSTGAWGSRVSGLWQLNDIERAIAETKFFPPNFAQTKRNLLFPITASRQQLLRRRPRTRRGALRVGRSKRSLLLQSLVRKINGVEDVALSSTDGENEQEKADGQTKEVARARDADGSRLRRFGLLESESGREDSSSETDARRQDSDSVTKSPGQTDGTGPQEDVTSPLGSGDGRMELSAIPNESGVSIDMHFSPQFVDPVPDLASVDETSAHTPVAGTTRQRNSGVPAPAAPTAPTTTLREASEEQKSQTNEEEERPRGVPPAAAMEVAKPTAPKSVNEGGGQQKINVCDLEKEEQMVGKVQGLASMPAAPPAAPSVESPEASESVTASSSTVDQCDAEEANAVPTVPRLRMTRRLQFEATEENTNSTQLKGNCVPEPPPRQSIVEVELQTRLQIFPTSKPVEEEVEVEAEGTKGIGSDESPAFSFALLPPGDREPLSAGKGEVLENPSPPLEPIQKANSTSREEDLDDDTNDEGPAFSFALLPPAGGKSAVIETSEPPVEIQSMPNNATPAFSFALLPPSDKGEAGAAEAAAAAEEATTASTSDGVPREDPLGFSIALLPPDTVKTTDVPRKSKRSLEMGEVEPKQEGEGLRPQGEGISSDTAIKVREKKVTSRATSTTEGTGRQGEASPLEGPRPMATAKNLFVDLTEECMNEETAGKDWQEHASGLVATQREDGCAICRETESFDDDPIVFCDGCDVAVHQFCYGIVTVPSGKWFCEVCKEVEAETSAPGKNQRRQPRCHLCPLRGGAFKRAACGRWVHVQCFLWIPELEVKQGEEDLLMLGTLSKLDPDRKTLDCSLCHSSKSHGIIQCVYERCLTAFHVSCAATAHYRMEQVDSLEGKNATSSGDGTLFVAYCPLHRNALPPAVILQQRMPPPSNRAGSRPLPRPEPAKENTPDTTSPSSLFSPPSGDSQKRFRCFRRLKRKYDASQSQVLSQSKSGDSPAVQSPWKKRVKRSKRHIERRKTLRALAASMFIEDDVEVHGEDKDGRDDEDDEDDEAYLMDDSFINDSSQLIYSQSAFSPQDEHKGRGTGKKRRRKPDADMRAIYARSLLESQASPLLLRRGGRQLSALPTNGVIQACLDQLKGGRSDTETTPSPRPKRSRTTSRSRDAMAALTSAESPISLLTQVPALATVAEESRGEESEDGTESEVVAPCFDLLGGIAAFSSNQESDSRRSETQKPAESARTTVNASEVQQASTASSWGTAVSPPVASVNHQKRDDGSALSLDQELMRERIEANRLKALKKLQQRRQSHLEQPKAHPRLKQPHQQLQQRLEQTPLSESGDSGGVAQPSVTVTAVAQTMITTLSFDLLESANAAIGPRSETQARRGAATTTGSGTDHQRSQQQFSVFVSSSFAVSEAFSVFVSAKGAGCSVDIESSLEADVLLGLRMPVLWLTPRQLRQLALVAPMRDVRKHPRVKTLLGMYKTLVVAVMQDASGEAPSQLPEVVRLRQLPNVTMVVQPQVESLCKHLHRLAGQEHAEGFHLPPLGMAPTSSSTALDEHFTSRLAFFRAIPMLSLGSAVSLTFRFKNFAAAQVPVRKFNEMHWRRMLPWVSEAVANEIHQYVERNMPPK